MITKGKGKKGKGSFKGECYNCGKYGHSAKYCNTKGKGKGKGGGTKGYGGGKGYVGKGYTAGRGVNAFGIGEACTAIAIYWLVGWLQPHIRKIGGRDV